MLYQLPSQNFVDLEPQSHPVSACTLPGTPGLQLLDASSSPLKAELKLTFSENQA